MDGACSTIGEEKNACRILMGKPERNSFLLPMRTTFHDHLIFLGLIILCTTDLKVLCVCFLRFSE
jgi:hypothetical protein